MQSFKFKYFTEVVVIFIMILLLLTPVYCVNQNTDTHAYTVPVVVNFVNISDNGECFYSSEVTYTLDESDNIVYYTIAKAPGESIDNITIENDGFYYDYSINDTGNSTYIKVSLFTDEYKKNKLTNKSVKIIYHYKSVKTLVLYEDVAVFNYTPWADTISAVSKLETYITYPAIRDDIQIYDNPPYIVSSHSWVNKHRYETRYKEILPNSDVKQIVLMPKESFKSNEYTNNINKTQKNQIIQYQNDYADSLKFNNSIGYLIIFISVILIVTPLVIYVKSFKNHNLSNLSIKDFEKLIDNYIKVNILLNDKKDTVNEDAFYSLILDFINRKFIKIKSRDDNLYLNFTSDNKGNMNDYEKIVYDYLSANNKKEISLDEIMAFYRHDDVLSIYENFKSICNKKHSIDDYLSTKTSKLFKYHSIIAFIYIVLAMILINILKPPVLIFIWSFRTIVVLIVIAIFSYILSSKINKMWNDEGKVHYSVCKKFESYLNDYNQIEINPPQTANKWANCIVYSAAMGVDLSFRQNMIRYINEHNRKDLLENDLIRLFYYDARRSLFLVN